MKNSFIRYLFLCIVTASALCAASQPSQLKPQVDIIAAFFDRDFNKSFVDLRKEVKAALAVTQKGKTDIIKGLSGLEATFSTSHKEYNPQTQQWERIANTPHMTLRGLDNKRDILNKLVQPSILIHLGVYLGPLRIKKIEIIKGDETRKPRRYYVALLVEPQIMAPETQKCLYSLANHFDALIRQNASLPTREMPFAPHITIATIIPRTFVEPKHKVTMTYIVTDQTIDLWNRNLAALNQQLAAIKPFYIDAILLKYWGPSSAKDVPEGGSRATPAPSELWSRQETLKNVKIHGDDILKACTEIKEELHTSELFLAPSLQHFLQQARIQLDYYFTLLKDPASLPFNTPDEASRAFIDFDDLSACIKLLWQNKVFDRQKNKEPGDFPGSLF